MQKKRILFLGETYRADAITWMEGLQEFGDFEIVTWELKNKSNGLYRPFRLFEMAYAFITLRNKIRELKVDMVIAERTTSYGFLAALSGIKPIAIAQQGISDLWPKYSLLYPFKKIIQDYTFKKATLLHAWGPVMAKHMYKSKVENHKVVVLAKGINIDHFSYLNKNNKTINAIVTRSLLPEYKHEVILKAFAIIQQQNIPFQLTIVGDGPLLDRLIKLAKSLNITKHVVFTGRINNKALPQFLQEANTYISMPTTEGVSASLFEAMACGCYPIVSDLSGNRCWIKNKENGILVPSCNEKKLAQAIIWSHENPNLITKAIAENRKFVVKNANYAINMKKIATLYHHLINTKSN